QHPFPCCSLLHLRSERRDHSERDARALLLEVPLRLSKNPYIAREQPGRTNCGRFVAIEQGVLALAHGEDRIVGPDTVVEAGQEPPARTAVRRPDHFAQHRINCTLLIRLEKKRSRVRAAQELTVQFELTCRERDIRTPHDDLVRPVTTVLRTV